MRPKGGIIKVSYPGGKFLYRIWLKDGIDRGEDYPHQKWDFVAEVHDHIRGLDEIDARVQIELTFEEEEE